MDKVTFIKAPNFGDTRGMLVAYEAGIDIPFNVKRVYCIYRTEKGVSRGFHAHLKLKQVVVCVSGSCRFRVHNGQEEKSFILNDPQKGLLIEGLIWREMHDFSPNCVLMVLASEHYEDNDYIRNFDQFLALTKQQQING